MTEPLTREQIALSLLYQNLKGEGWDQLKPISVELANRMANVAFAAFHNQPNQDLDEAVENTRQYEASQ